jgi:cytochrome c oxidase assembly factor CtaG/putative copper export protein
MSNRRSRFVVAFLASLIALTATLVAVGNVRVHHLPGLPFSPALTLWLLPVSRLVADLSAVVMVGALLIAVVVLPRASAHLSDDSRRLAEVASYAAFANAGANLSLVIFAVSDILGIPPTASLNGSTLTSYLTQLTGGRVSLFQITSALLISLLATRIKNSASGFLLLLLALIAVAAPALTGHGGLSANHEIATSSLALHIVALSLWVGGLFSLAIVVRSNPPDLASMVSRFSAVALGCYVAVVLSGVANAWVRMRSLDNLFGSNFGRLVLLKVGLTIFLTYSGWLHRRRTIISIRAGKNSLFYRIAGVEVAIMFAIVGVAVTLSRTGFPRQAFSLPVQPTPSELLYGFALPPTPRLLIFVTYLRIDALWLAFALVLLSVYLSSFRKARSAGLTWPISRVISFGVGSLLIVYATSGALAAYSHVLFSAHMVQHILLLLIIPEFLVFGQPFRLALLAHSLGASDAPSLTRDFLAAKLLKNLSRLPVVVTLFASSFYLLYFTPIFPDWLPSHWGHVSMETIIFVVGYLFIWNVFGNDAAPVVHSPWSRFAALLISEPFHILFSVLLIWSGRVLASDFYASLRRPYAADLHGDQVLGGVLGWLLGEVPMFLAAGLLIRTLSRATWVKSRSV